MGQAKQEENIAYESMHTATEKGQVAEMLDGIQVQITNLEADLRLVLTPEPEETPAQKMQNPSRSGLVHQLDSIHTSLLKLNKRLDL